MFLERSNALERPCLGTFREFWTVPEKTSRGLPGDIFQGFLCSLGPDSGQRDFPNRRASSEVFMQAMLLFDQGVCVCDHLGLVLEGYGPKDSRSSCGLRGVLLETA